MVNAPAPTIAGRSLSRLHAHHCVRDPSRNFRTRRLVRSLAASSTVYLTGHLKRCIVDQNIQFAKLIEGGIDHMFAVLLIAYVARKAHGFAAGVFDPTACLLGVLLLLRAVAD